MAKTVNVLTIVPMEVAVDLSKKGKIVNYNTLSNIDSNVLEAVRDFMTENVGYDDMPLACLNANAKSFHMDSSEIFHYLPTNANNSYLLFMQMPEDMIVSIRHQDLLDASNEIKAVRDDPDTVEMIKEEFKEILTLGQGDFDPDEEVIEFIPYLDYNKCKGYAALNEDFGVQGSPVLPDKQKIALAKLSAFIN